MSFEPRWLNEAILRAIHSEQVRSHGGTLGVRNPDALESSLGRPRMFLQYNPEADVLTLAAVLGHGLCTSHPFADGNKRVSLMAMYVLLALNGWLLQASEPETVQTILQLACGEMDEESLADWLRRNSVPQ